MSTLLLAISDSHVRPAPACSGARERPVADFRIPLLRFVSVDSVSPL
jgi:hypothetical protein